MDKPSLLSVIQANIPENVPKEVIEDLIHKEIMRQLEVVINGIVHKKPITELEVVLKHLKTFSVKETLDNVLPGISDDHIAAPRTLGVNSVHTPKSTEESKVARLPAKLKKRK